MNIGEKIRRLRHEKGLSLDKLGVLSSTSKSYLCKLEDSSSQNPTMDKLIKISLALGVTSEYLANEDTELNNAILEKAFFRKFNNLSESNKQKVGQLIELWGKDT